MVFIHDMNRKKNYFTTLCLVSKFKSQLKKDSVISWPKKPFKSAKIHPVFLGAGTKADVQEAAATDVWPILIKAVRLFFHNASVETQESCV